MDHTTGLPKRFRDPDDDAAVPIVNWLRHALIEALREVYVIDTKHVLRLAEDVAKALYARGGDIERPSAPREEIEAQLRQDIIEIIGNEQCWAEEPLEERIRVVSSQLAERQYKKKSA